MSQIMPISGGVPLSPLAEVRPAAGIFAKIWWDLPTKTVVGVYDAINAVSQAAAKVNLINPGTYDLVAVGVEPTWGANGFVGTAVGCYNTGISATSAIQTVLVKFNNLVNDATYGFFGSIIAGPKRFAMQSTTGGTIFYVRDKSSSDTNSLTSGVVGMSGYETYIDGSNVGTIPTSAIGYPGGDMYLMGTNFGGGSYLKGNVSSAIFIAEALTPSEMLSLSSSMP